MFPHPDGDDVWLSGICDAYLILCLLLWQRPTKSSWGWAFTQFIPMVPPSKRFE